MYECRCPNDGKKLVEMARPPLALGHYDYPCECGSEGLGQAAGKPALKSLHYDIDYFF